MSWLRQLFSRRRLYEDAKFYDLRQGPPRTIYLLLSTKRIDDLGNLVFLMHTPTKAQAKSAFRKAFRKIASSVPLVIFVTGTNGRGAGESRADHPAGKLRCVLVLLLSALGLYRLLSASGTQRKNEIGVRVALGASRGRVVGIILKQALTLLGWGMLRGAAGLLLTTRFVEAMLHGVAAYDPLALGVVAGTLVIAAMLAALAPAVRAATLDPIEVLKAE